MGMVGSIVIFTKKTKDDKFFLKHKNEVGFVFLWVVDSSNLVLSRRFRISMFFGDLKFSGLR